MRTPRFCVALLVIIPAVALNGCFSSDSKPADGDAGGVQATPGQIVASIVQMSASAAVYSETPDRHILTEQLAAMGPAALAPLIDFMGAPDTAATARLFILQCVNNYLTPAYLPNLKPMLESKDEVTRAVAVMALGHIRNEAVSQLLTIARNDPSERVAFSALSGLAMQGNADARQELKQMYTSDTTQGQIKLADVKREVVRVLLRDAQPDDLPILQDALNQDFLAINFRIMIAETLGRLGDKTAISALEESLNLQSEPEYGEMVKQAITAINQRAEQA